MRTDRGGEALHPLCTQGLAVPVRVAAGWFPVQASARARGAFSPERFPVFILQDGGQGTGSFYGFPEHGQQPGGWREEGWGRESCPMMMDAGGVALRVVCAGVRWVRAYASLCWVQWVTRA